MLCCGLCESENGTNQTCLSWFACGCGFFLISHTFLYEHITAGIRLACYSAVQHMLFRQVAEYLTRYIHCYGLLMKFVYSRRHQARTVGIQEAEHVTVRQHVKLRIEAARVRPTHVSPQSTRCFPLQEVGVSRGVSSVPGDQILRYRLHSSTKMSSLCQHLAL